MTTAEWKRVDRPARGGDLGTLSPFSLPTHLRVIDTDPRFVSVDFRYLDGEEPSMRTETTPGIEILLGCHTQRVRGIRISRETLDKILGDNGSDAEGRLAKALTESIHAMSEARQPSEQNSEAVVGMASELACV